MNEKRAAVLEVRRCAKVFLAEYNLQFPSCMESMRYHPPNSIYKALDLDKALMNNIVDNAEEAGRGRETAKLKYAISRDMLVYRNKVPQHFQFYNRSMSDPDSLTREEFWFMLDDAEREELIRENFENLIDITCSKIRIKTEGDHYQSCMRNIRRGQEAMRKHMRTKNTVTQRAVDTFFKQRRDKRKADEMTADLLSNGLVIEDLDESEFM